MIGLKRLCIYTIFMPVGLLFFNTPANAQDSPEEKEKKQILHYMGIELGMFFNFSGIDLTDDFNLEEIIESSTGLNTDGMFGELGTNLILTNRIKKFKKKTFINLYGVPLMERPEGVFDRLNNLAQGYHDPRNAPFINAFIWAVPEGEVQFKIKIDLFAGDLAIEEALVEAENAMNAMLTKTYTKVGEAKQDINAAMAAGLSSLEGSLGNNFMPPFMISYDGDYYGPGNTIEMWSSPEPVELYAAKSMGNGVFETTLATWQIGGVEQPQPQPVSILTFNAVPGTYKVTATIGNNEVELNVRVKDGNGLPSVKTMLKAIVREVFNEKQKGLTEELASKRSDSTSLAIANVKPEIPLPSFNGDGVGVIGEQFFLQDFDKLIWEDLEVTERDVDVETERALYNKVREILIDVHIEQFLYAIIDDPAKFDDFVDDLMVNSGRLLARFALNALKDEERVEVKALVVEYVNERIENIAYENL